MFSFHKHNFVESKDSNRVIYCTICGKTKVLPCDHKFGRLLRTEWAYCEFSGDYYIKYIKECKRCGEFHSFSPR